MGRERRRGMTDAEGRPRVVVLGHVARLSGGEIALLRLLPALRRYADVRVILGEDGPLVERLRALEIPVEVLPIPPSLRDLRKGAISPGRLDPRSLASLPAYVVRLRARLREIDPDIVHTNTLKAALYGGIAGRLIGRPVLWHIRDRIAADYLPTMAVRLVHLAARMIPSAVVTNSYATLETLPRVNRMRVLHNPVAPDAVIGPEREPRDHVGKVVFGVVGRLAPWKGQDVFIRAFATAFAEEDARARLIGSAMFGEEAYAESLQRLVESLGMTEKVEFRGFREDVWGELADLDVLVHASITAEPFGQVVLEGMAAGIPVVASDAGGPAELITDEVHGLLTPPGDVAALAAVLRRLADDPDLRSRLGRAARARSADFTPERAAKQLAEVYRSLTERSSRMRR